MLKRIFKESNLGWATFLVSITAFLSYAVGLVRDRVIATTFGTSTATDTYQAAFLIPDMLFNFLIAGGLIAAFLPVFSDYLNKDESEGVKIANTVITTGALLISTLSVLIYIFMEPLIHTLFPHSSPQMQSDIIAMTKIMIPSALFFTISNTLGNVLMNYKHFLAYALSPVLYNFGIIFGVIFFSERIGIYSAAYGVLIGAALHCVIRIVDVISTGFKFRPTFAIFSQGFRKIILLMLPRTVSLALWQLNVYLFAYVGIKLTEGGLAAFNFSKNIQSFAVSLFGIAFATAVFPYLTTAIAKNDHNEYAHNIQKTIERILFFTIPSAIGLLIMSKPIVELILSGGVFDEKSVQLTSLILFYFALSIPFESLTHIFSRAFYARQNTITPMLINGIGMIFMAFSTLYLSQNFGIKWFSLGFTFSMIIQVIFYLILLKRDLKQFNFKKLGISIGKTLLATLIMATFLVTIHIPHILEIAGAAAVFLMTSYFLKADELRALKDVFKKFSRS